MKRVFGRDIQNLPQVQKKQQFSPGKIAKIQIQNLENTFEKKFLNTCSTKDRSSSTMEEECFEELLIQQEPQMVSQYAEEIFQYLDENEISFVAPPSYMDRFQVDINPRMRTILIDWLVEVHLKFKLVPQTLFLTVNLIDRYLSQNQVSRNQLQLFGVAAMFIAAKYEEIYAPDLKDFVYICDKAYTKQDILQAEGLILLCIQFNLNYTSPLRFLERYITLVEKCNAESLDIFKSETFYMAQYLLELALHDYDCLQYQPSLQAASALYLAQKFLNFQNDFPSIYTEQSLKKCARSMALVMQSSYQAVKRKFSLPIYYGISQKDLIL